MKKRETPEVVVVTGASAGLGRAIARRFGEAGAHVALVARAQCNLERYHVRRVCDEYQVIYDAACEALRAGRRDEAGSAPAAGQDRVAQRS